MRICEDVFYFLIIFNFVFGFQMGSTLFYQIMIMISFLVTVKGEEVSCLVMSHPDHEA